VTGTEQFLGGLDALGVAIFTGRPGVESEFERRPNGWADLDAAGNGQRQARWRPGDALCGVTGRVAGLDCDPRNGCDPAEVRRAMSEIGVRIYAEIATPGDGAHFYAPGHPDLATAYTLDGWPGLEIHSWGACMYLPGTQRPKYDGRGYHIVRDDLAALLDGDDDSAVALLDWADTHRPGSGESFPLAPRWNGTAPDRRQAAYLAAALDRQARELAGMAPDTGRNRALYIGALKLGNYVAGAGLAEQNVIDALAVACEHNGLVRDDGARSVAASIRSGLRNGKQSPRAVPPAPEATVLDAAGDTWEEPLPLRPVAVLPLFPTSALPDWLAQFVAAESVATQTPADLAGMLALSAVAALAAGIVRVQIRPGWQEPVNIYTATALPPGARKSAVFADMTRPLVRFDSDEVDRMRAIILEETVSKKIAERARDQAETAAGKATADSRDRLAAEAIDAADKAARIIVPAAPRLLADDATPEALSSLLADSPYGRIALMSPEGGLFEMMAGRYQSGPNLDVYLKGHAGDSIRVDRKSRNPEFVERPAVTVGLAVQPEVLRVLEDRPGFRGRGLLARFLYALPVNTVGGRVVGAPAVPREIGEAYRDKMQALARSLRDEAEAARLRRSASADDAAIGEGEVIVLTFDVAADLRLREFETELEPRLHPDSGDLAPVTDWAAKLAGAVARVAALLHLAETVDGRLSEPVTVATVGKAIEIGRYLIGHAVAAFDLMGNSDPALADARLFLQWIERTGAESFTRRDLFRALTGHRFPKVTALDPGIGLLEAHGYLRRTASPAPGSTGGRPRAPVFEVNPNWHAVTC
jgi:replicative DNA helicase